MPAAPAPAPRPPSVITSQPQSHSSWPALGCRSWTSRHLSGPPDVWLVGSRPCVNGRVQLGLGSCGSRFSGRIAATVAKSPHTTSLPSQGARLCKGGPRSIFGASAGPPVRLLLPFLLLPLPALHGPAPASQLPLSTVTCWPGSCLPTGSCFGHRRPPMLGPKPRSHPCFSSCLRLDIQPASNAGVFTSKPPQGCSLRPPLS